MKKKAPHSVRPVGRPVGASGINKSKLIVESFNRGNTKPREIAADIKKRTGHVVTTAYVGVIKAQKNLSNDKNTREKLELAASKFIFSLGGSFKDAITMIKDLDHLDEVSLVLKCGSVAKAVSVIEKLQKKAK